MARWGATESLPLDLCQIALTLLRPTHDKLEGQAARDLQRLSLLYWAIGDSEQASTLLDRALEESDRAGFISYRERGVSNWTFREASAHEFRQHCEEQRRMIRGEPVRPGFLGPR
jgi:hypothetical protein